MNHIPLLNILPFDDDVRASGAIAIFEVRSTFTGDLAVRNNKARIYGGGEVTNVSGCVPGCVRKERNSPHSFDYRQGMLLICESMLRLIVERNDEDSKLSSQSGSSHSLRSKSFGKHGSNYKIMRDLAAGKLLSHQATELLFLPIN